MKNFEIKNNGSLAPCGRERQSGRSMIEMLGVLAIIGVLSVGGIAGYSKAMQKYRINKTIEQITLIAGNVRTFFAPQGNYEGISNNSVTLKAKLFPDEMIEYNTNGSFKQFTNVFGLQVTLTTAHKSANTDKKAFYINYTLPDNEENCIELVSQDWTDAGAKGVYIYYPGASKFLSVPVTLDAAVTACSDVIKAIMGSPKMIWFMLYFDVNANCWNETNGNNCS